MTSKHYDDLGAGKEWGTPPGIVNPIERAVGGFDLDPASGAEPEPYARERFTIDDDGLKLSWFGRVWLNPPYGQKHNPAWGRKVIEEARRDDVESITALVPAATGTAWFGNTYARAGAITVLHKRVPFIDAEDETEGDVNNATFGSAIAHFGNFPTEYFEAMNDLTVTTPAGNVVDVPTTTWSPAPVA